VVTLLPQYVFPYKIISTSLAHGNLPHPPPFLTSSFHLTFPQSPVKGLEVVYTIPQCHQSPTALSRRFFLFFFVFDCMFPQFLNRFFPLPPFPPIFFSFPQPHPSWPTFCTRLPLFQCPVSDFPPPTPFASRSFFLVPPSLHRQAPPK